MAACDARSLSTTRNASAWRSESLVVEELLAVLEKGGPLGLAVICMAVAGYIYRSKETLRDEHIKEIGTLNRDHAAEIARLNDKRLEDIKAVLSALGTFDTGRASINESVERLSDALAAHSATLSELRDKIVELWHRGQQRGVA